jgi:hypothetical protein
LSVFKEKEKFSLSADGSRIKHWKLFNADFELFIDPFDVKGITFG